MAGRRGAPNRRSVALKNIDIIQRHFYRFSPHSFATFVSEGKWIPYTWLVHASKIVREAIMQGGGRIILNVPPRHGKSELFSHWLPTWFFDNFPDKRIILTSYAAALAQEFGAKVRDTFLNNERTSITLVKGALSAGDWKTREGGGMVSAGVGGPITGKGGHLLILDDPYKNMREAMSPTIRETVKSWFSTTFYTRCEPNATIIIIMTRWTDNDICEYLTTEHTDKWTKIEFPALCEKADGDVIGRAEGMALCPERYPTDELLRIKEGVGHSVFDAMYQQRPAAIEGNIIKHKWLKYWLKLPEKFDDEILSWDMSFKNTTDGSFVVGQAWGRLGSQCFLKDQIRARMEYMEARAAVREFSIRHPKALIKLIEDKANGPAIISDLRNEIAGIIPVPATDSKEARLQSVSPFFEAGNVFIPDPSLFEWIPEYIFELTRFPRSKFDDQVDGTSQALIKLRELMQTGGTANAGDVARANEDFIQESYWSGL